MQTAEARHRFYMYFSSVINPIPPRKAKIVFNFGLSECNRVKKLFKFGLSEFNRVNLVKFLDYQCAVLVSTFSSCQSVTAKNEAYR